MIRFTPLRLLALALCVSTCAVGYIPLTITTSTTPAQTIQVTRADNAGIQFYLNSSVVAGAQSSVSNTTVITASSNPAAAVEAAMATWNNVGSANIHFNALQTTAVTEDPANPGTICTNLITIGATPDDLSVLGYVSPSSPGVLAVTSNAIVTATGAGICGLTTSVNAGTIVASDIVLNPYIQFSTDSTANTSDLQGILTHELGHSLGMNHSALLGATMFPRPLKFARHLSWDEKAFAATYYPSGTKSLGTVSGTVTIGASPVSYGLVTLIDLSGGQKTIGTLTAADGTYSVQAPPGSYDVYAEPFNNFVGATNIYSRSTSTGVLDPTQVTTGFEPTMSGGNATPTSYTVSGGSSSTANISVTSGATSLGTLGYGVGRAGANGDITTFLSGPIPVTAGQSFDVAFAGPGIDATIVPYFIGTNITIVGSPRVDSAVTTTLGPLIRVTLAIGAQTNATLGTLWIARGTNYLPLSGILDVEPMAPTVNTVSDAESARASFTSGQWVAVYGANLANGSESWNANTDFTGGVDPGDPLPSVLGGVSVTVNSIPASVYYVSPTQINFLAPSGLPATGTTNVVVSNFGTPSAPFNVSVAQASPSFFYNPVGGTVYPLAVHLTAPYNLIGDPAVAGGGYENAHPGETIEMFVNGIAPSTGGVIATVTPFAQTTVAITAGSTPLTVSEPYLVAAGEFQINVTLPASIAAGTYQLTMTVPNGSTSTSGITVNLPVGP